MTGHERIHFHAEPPRPSLAYRIAEALTLPLGIAGLIALLFVCSWVPQ